MRKHHEFHPTAVEGLEDRTALSSFATQSAQVQVAIMNSPSFNVANMVGSMTSNPFSNTGAASNFGFMGTQVGLFGTGILNTPTMTLGGTSAGFGTGTAVVSPGLGSSSAANLGVTLANAANQFGTLTPNTISNIVSALTPNPSPIVGRTASPSSNFGMVGTLGTTVVTTGFQGTRVGLFGTGILNTPTGILGGSAGFGNGISVVSPGLGGIGFMGF